MNARGVVYVHSSPTAVCPHVEWAISGVLGEKVSLQWTPQSSVPGQLRAECTWTGPVGSGGALAGALRAWSMLRFEVTEEPTPGVDGERFCHVPTLGLWHGRTSANGDIMVGEDQLRALLGQVPANQVPGRIRDLLGAAWDDALEPFRLAGDGAPVTWLHQVG
ncbi:DUF3145 domain-containing protein [Pseudonocardia sp. 73-21]|uniref:DUF3145 domain-containing protein n=1 Tax=Pseudonocardia sp. 73-21 TaxID=1895809 RepID=UPI00095E129A|nr:DUF3145 domain-containing protein [Pseudonocardia sp. 73-21]OJY48602.1 MAG: hypothetical protein BGP03_04865 [Pseudonocardia sp. 73-21]